MSCECWTPFADCIFIPQMYHIFITALYFCDKFDLLSPCFPHVFIALQLFVFTDGEVANTKEVIDLVKKNSGTHRWSCYYLEWPRKTQSCVLIVFVLRCLQGVSPSASAREPALLSSMDWLEKEEATPSSLRGLTGCSPKWDHCETQKHLSLLFPLASVQKHCQLAI